MLEYPTMTRKRKDNSLRNAEYYSTLDTYDKLYYQSNKGIIFDDLMPLILSETNIRLAYRNIKNNNGSHTSGVDKKTIEYVKNMKLGSFIKWIRNSFNNYQPHVVRRVFILKKNGKQRPLGIPTIRDRIMQQCLKQILEPIVEATFHKNSNGFRPYKSCESAMAQLTNYIYRDKCYYVVDIDIKGFFDNVDHGKLLKQLWTLKIRDKKLLKIISKMLKAEVLNEGIPTKGTPQGGILSPLLANIVLNELDWWLSNQWMTYKTKKTFKEYVSKNGYVCSNQRNWLRKNTKLKEFYFVRYADDFKIICKNYNDAVKLKIATTNFLKERLNLEVSEEKTKIVNLKKNYSNFLGFKIKVRKKKKGNCRYTIISHIDNEASKKVQKDLKEQLRNIKKTNNNKEKIESINNYNSKVIGIHNYYSIATSISIDMSNISTRLLRLVQRTLKQINFLYIPRNLNNGFIENKYGKSKGLIDLGGIYLVPISYVQFKKPVMQSNDINKFTKVGRQKVHTGLECMKYETIKEIVNNPFYNKTVELNDIIIPRLAGQWGKCYITRCEINSNNLDYAYKNDKLKDKDKYSNIIIIDSSIKNLLLRKNGDIMEVKQKLKGKEKIGLVP